MSNFLTKLRPELFLRAGFGIMYLYSGFDLFYNPQHWYGFVPQWFSRIIAPIPVETYLRIQGSGEIVIGLLFLIPFFGTRGWRIAALIAVLEMLLITVLVGIDPITFRDIGLLGGAAALFIISYNNFNKIN